MILIQPSDFVGQYQIAQNNNITPILQSYIDREEKRTIYMLLGQVLGDLIIAYLAANKTPAVARYDNIINSFYIQNNNFGGLRYSRQTDNQSPAFYESSGLKDLLLCAAFYYYVTETSGMKSTQSGITSPKSDTSDGASQANIFRFAEQKWNKSGYDTWLAIWWRCCIYENSTYPEFTGVLPSVKYGSLF